MPLPVADKVRRRALAKGEVHHPLHLIAVRRTTVVLAPSRLLRKPQEVRAGDPVIVATLAEIKRRNLNYEQLAEKLDEQFGVKDTGKNLSNKIGRGGFTAGFFIMCLEAIGAKAVRLED